MREKKKILVVEDEPAVASLMTFLLARAGYEVENAFNGTRGLELGTTQRFNLILLDVDLPDMKGFEICRELKQRWICHHTPIIFLSGNAIEERRAKALELGAEDFIAKPFIVDDFMERIAFHISSAETSGTVTATGEAA